MEQLQDQDSDGEDDPSKLLDHWLGELNTLGKVSGRRAGESADPPHIQGLNTGVRSSGSQLVTPRPVLRPQDPEGGARQRKQEYRCSLINLDTSQDDELEAILGELTVLQGEFETEIQDDKRRSVDQKDGSGDSALSPVSEEEQQQHD